MAADGDVEEVAPQAAQVEMTPVTDELPLEEPVGVADVLATLDNAKVSAFHFKAIIVAGMGFFTDAYDLFSISLLTNLLGRIYYQDSPMDYYGDRYGGDQFAPWWGVSQNGVVQPFGNTVPVVPGMPYNYSSTGAFGLSNSAAGNIPGGYVVMRPSTTSSSGFGISTTAPAWYSAYNKGRVAPGALPINLNAAVSSVALCGTLAGQLFFGWAGDRFGRKSVYGLTLFVMIFCAAAQAQSFGTTGVAVIGTLCWWRFFLGFGVGGDYPLSATIMSEYSSRLSRGAFVSAVFAMQGVGILAAATVAIIVTSCFNAYYPARPYPPDDMAANPQLYWAMIQQSVPRQADYVWRIVLGFGFFPAACTLYMRATFPETPRYTLHVEHNKEQVAKDMSEVTHVHVDASHTKETTKTNMTFSQFLRKHGKELLGCAMCWFLLDVAFYSQNLFQSTVFNTIGLLPPGNTMNALTATFRIARAQAVIALGSTIPGYYFTVFTVDHLGRRKIQYMGFILMTTFMAAIAGGYNGLLNHNTLDGSSLNNLQPFRRNGFVAMYAFCFFFANWGPNATTFVIPAELFPTKWKATGHGISAASGKAGAIIGAFGFLYASQPRENEVIWKIPCVNSQTFVFPSFALSDKVTAYIQNLAVRGFPTIPVPDLQNSGKIFLASPPWKNSLVLTADQSIASASGSTAAAAISATLQLGASEGTNGYSKTLAYNASYLASLGNACPWYTDGTKTAVINGPCTTSNFKVGALAGAVSDGSSLSATTADGNTHAAYLVATTFNLSSTTFAWNVNFTTSTLTPWYQAAVAGGSVSGSGNNAFVALPNAPWATPEGVANPQSYGFPQVGINGKNIQTYIPKNSKMDAVVNTLPAQTTGCLIKPNCPGGMIATPAINNGKPSYQCVCPIPKPQSGCYPYGIGIQGAVGILAATNFLGMLFTALVPETNGKTLEELNDESSEV